MLKKAELIVSLFDGKASRGQRIGMLGLLRLDVDDMGFLSDCEEMDDDSVGSK